MGQKYVEVAVRSRPCRRSRWGLPPWRSLSSSTPSPPTAGARLRTSTPQQQPSKEKKEKEEKRKKETKKKEEKKNFEERGPSRRRLSVVATKKTQPQPQPTHPLTHSLNRTSNPPTHSHTHSTKPSMDLPAIFAIRSPWDTTQRDTPRTVVLRLFYGCSTVVIRLFHGCYTVVLRLFLYVVLIGFTCPATTGVTVIWSLQART